MDVVVVQAMLLGLAVVAGAGIVLLVVAVVWWRHRRELDSVLNRLAVLEAAVHEGVANAGPKPDNDSGDGVEWVHYRPTTHRGRKRTEGA